MYCPQQFQNCTALAFKSWLRGCCKTPAPTRTAVEYDRDPAAYQAALDPDRDGIACPALPVVTTIDPPSRPH
jgi:hypothetical protein